MLGLPAQARLSGQRDGGACLAPVGERLIAARFEFRDAPTQVGGPDFQARDLGQKVGLRGIGNAALRFEEPLLVVEHFGPQVQCIALAGQPILGLLTIRDRPALTLGEQFPCGFQPRRILLGLRRPAIQLVLFAGVEFAEPRFGGLGIGADSSARGSFGRPAHPDAVETFFVQGADPLLLGRDGEFARPEFLFGFLDALRAPGEIGRGRLPFHPKLLADFAELLQQFRRGE